jgi:hypothetical protein
VRYLLDTNVFVQAKNFYYRRSICPGFWDWLDTAVENQFGTIDRVRAETLKGNDDVSRWFKERKGASWIAETHGEPTQQAFREVVGWVTRGAAALHPERAAFLAGADPWLVAHAMTTKATVVSLEVPKNSPNKVSVADVCAAFKVPVIKTWDLLELCKARFVLDER